MNFNQFNEVKDIPLKRFSESPLSKMGINKTAEKSIIDYDKPLAAISDDLKKYFSETCSEQSESSDAQDSKKPIQNKLDGLKREEDVKEELEKKYPESEGYTILSEVYFRDEHGKIVKDPVTGEARRIDYVVIKDGKVVDSIEVTSKTADKTEQTAKENRIRDNGGNYIKDSEGNLIKIPDDVQTRIERRD